MRNRVLQAVAVAAITGSVVAAPASAAPWDVVLGKAGLYPSSTGYGTVAPRTVDNSGVCGGIMHDITWTGWGSPTAVGTGKRCHSAGAISRGEPVRRIVLTASNIGLCAGRIAYRTMRYSDGDTVDICPR